MQGSVTGGYGSVAAAEGRSDGDTEGLSPRVWPSLREAWGLALPWSSDPPVLEGSDPAVLLLDTPGPGALE